MGYNEDLENRIDLLIDRLGEIAKKRMFGGIGYLINGNMKSLNCYLQGTLAHYYSKC